MCSNARFHTLVYFIQKTFSPKSQFSIVSDNRNIINYQIHEIEEVWSFFQIGQASV